MFFVPFPPRGRVSVILCSCQHLVWSAAFLLYFGFSSCFFWAVSHLCVLKIPLLLVTSGVRPIPFNGVFIMGVVALLFRRCGRAFRLLQSLPFLSNAVTMGAFLCALALVSPLWSNFSACFLSGHLSWATRRCDFTVSG